MRRMRSAAERGITARHGAATGIAQASPASFGRRRRKVRARVAVRGRGARFLMVSLGGATRLTGSGLSITEWQPIMGAVPPLSDAAWQEAFDKYRADSPVPSMSTGA